MENFTYPEESIWIGVDVGTTGVRAIAYQKDGKNLCSSEEFFPLETPYPDWAEQNVELIYSKVEYVIKDVTKMLKNKGKQPTGIALSTVMHSFIPVNKNKKLLGNMMTWADSRSSNIVEELKNNKEGDNWYQKTGCPLHACYPLTKLLWLKKNNKATFQKMKYIYSIKDYIFEKITGKWLIDKSTASATGMFNVHTLNWDEEILDFIGITTEQLPNIVSTLHKEYITAETSNRLKLPLNLPVVIGATDGVLVNLGIGAISKGQISATIGTSGAVRMLATQPIVDSEKRTWCYNLTDDLWVVGGAINNGGIILRWVKEKICHYAPEKMADLEVDPYDLMTLKASKVKTGSDGLLLLPFFTGERAPYWNSELKGMFFGLSLKHGISHMIRATMEGIAFSLLCVYEVLETLGDIKDIRVSGSFTKSSLWLQILADILNRELSIPDNSEGAAFGAAMLGFLANKEINSIDDIVDNIGVKAIIKPNKDNTKVYQELYKIYKSLYLKCVDEYKMISEFQKKLYK